MLRHKKYDHNDQALRLGRGLRRGYPKQGCSYANESLVAYSVHTLHVHRFKCAACGSKFEEFAALVKHREGPGKDGACARKVAEPNTTALEITAPGMITLTATKLEPNAAVASGTGVTPTTMAAIGLARPTPPVVSNSLALPRYALATTDLRSSTTAETGQCTAGGPAMASLAGERHQATSCSGRSSFDLGDPSNVSVQSPNEYSGAGLGLQKSQWEPARLPQWHSTQHFQATQAAVYVPPPPPMDVPYISPPAPGQSVDSCDPTLHHLLRYAFRELPHLTILGTADQDPSLPPAGPYVPFLPSGPPPQHAPATSTVTFVPCPPLPQSVVNRDYVAADFDPSRVWNHGPLNRSSYEKYPDDIDDNHIFSGDPNKIAYDNILRLATRYTNSQIFENANKGRPRPAFNSKATVTTRIASAIAHAGLIHPNGVEGVERELNDQKRNNGLVVRQKKRKRDDHEQLAGIPGDRQMAVPKNRMRTAGPNPNLQMQQPMMPPTQFSPAPTTVLASMNAYPPQPPIMAQPAASLTPSTITPMLQMPTPPQETPTRVRALPSPYPTRPDPHGLRGSFYYNHVRGNGLGTGCGGARNGGRVDRPVAPPTPASSRTSDIVIDLTEDEEL